MPSLEPISGPLGEQRARHLLRRLTYGATSLQISAFAALTPTQALAQLFDFELPPPPLDDTGVAWTTTTPQIGENEDHYIHLLKCWWLGRMYEENSALERLTFFLHTVLTTKAETVGSSRALYFQLQMFRTYLYNDFHNTNPQFNRYTQLIQKICIDNAMLIFLDGRLNEKGRPNENFARELFELYTIGKGETIAPGNYTNYTEQDIREAAKVLTGWTNDPTFQHIDPDTGLPAGHIKQLNGIAIRHDNSIKTFSSALASPAHPTPQIIPDTNLLQEGQPTLQSAYDEIRQLIDIIYALPEAARFFCRKLYRYFVYHDITDAIENEVITPLAETFVSNGFRLRPVLEQLFSSQHFYEAMPGVQDDKFGAIIKSPLELCIGTLRSLRHPGFQLSRLEQNPAQHYMQTGAVLNCIRRMGLDFLEPYDVAGYDPYHQIPNYHRLWITTNNLAQRYAFIRELMNPTNGWGFWFDSLQWANDTAASGITDEIATTAEVVDGMELALGLVRHIIRRFLPFTNADTDFTPERFHYFGVFHLGGLSFANWVFNWNNRHHSSNPTFADDTRARLNRLLNAILQSPEYQLH